MIRRSSTGILFAVLTLCFVFVASSPVEGQQKGKIYKLGLRWGTPSAVLWNPTVAAKSADWRELRPAAATLGLTLESREVRRPGDFAAVFDAVRHRRPDALLVLSDPLVGTMRSAIAGFVARERLPAMYALRVYAESGGLVSYGADLADLHRRAAGHVDRILRGARPADLPVEQATKFELVINLKTAKALGLTIPDGLLRRADHVIE